MLYQLQLKGTGVVLLRRDAIRKKAANSAAIILESRSSVCDSCWKLYMRSCFTQHKIKGDF